MTSGAGVLAAGCASSPPQPARASTRSEERAPRSDHDRSLSIACLLDEVRRALRRGRRLARAGCASTRRADRARRRDRRARPRAALPRGRARGRRALRAGPRRDQLRLGLVRASSGPAPTRSRARLTAHARARGGPWTAAELRGARRARRGRGPRARSRARAHRASTPRRCDQLGGWLGDRGALDAVAAASGSAERFAAALAAGMPFFDDRGFYKRAQIAANDLRAGGRRVVRRRRPADDLRRQPRSRTSCASTACCSYADELAALVDGGDAAGGRRARWSASSAPARCTPARCSPAGSASAGARSTTGSGTAAEEPYRSGRAHVTRTVFY